jgi:hypothetical protein
MGLATNYCQKGAPTVLLIRGGLRLPNFLADAHVDFLFSNDTRLADTAGHVSFFRFNSAAQAHERSYRALG